MNNMNNKEYYIDLFKSKENCFKYLRTNGHLIKYIEDQIEEFCVIAIQNKPSSFYLIKPKFLTPYIILIYIKNNGYITEIFEEFEDIYIKAIEYEEYIFSNFIAQTERICLTAVECNHKNFLQVVNQTEKICRLAIETNSNNFKFVVNQTEKLCIQAVSRNHLLLDYVHDQTEEICYQACLTHNSAFTSCRIKSDKICKLVLQNNGSYIKYINDQTYDLCLLSLKKSGINIKFIRAQTEELCFIACSNDYTAFLFCKIQSDRICKLVLQNNGSYIKYIKDQKKEYCILAVKENPHNLKFIINQDEEICLTALENCPSGSVFSFVKNQTHKICVYAVLIHRVFYDYIKNPTIEMCEEIIQYDPDLLEYITNQPVDFYLNAYRNGFDILKINPDKLFEVILQKPEIIKIIKTINSSMYVKINTHLSEHIYSITINTEIINVDYKVLLLLLTRNDWIDFLIKYFYNYIYYFKITLLDDNNIEFFEIIPERSFVKFSFNPIYTIFIQCLRENKMTLHSFLDQPSRFYLEVCKNGIDISNINNNALIKTIRLDPVIITTLSYIHQDTFMKIMKLCPEYLHYVNLDKVKFQYVNDDILSYFLSNKNWIHYIIKYFEKYLEYYDLTLINKNNIKFINLNSKEVIIKNYMLDFDKIFPYDINIHLEIFQINSESCVICFNSHVTTNKYCSNLHTSGNMCYTCYKTLINSDNPFCCLCRNQLLTLF
jgi:hypothetical protein